MILNVRLQIALLMRRKMCIGDVQMRMSLPTHALWWRAPQWCAGDFCEFRPSGAESETRPESPLTIIMFAKRSMVQPLALGAFDRGIIWRLYLSRLADFLPFEMADRRSIPSICWPTYGIGRISIYQMLSWGFIRRVIRIPHTVAKRDKYRQITLGN